MEKNLIVTFVAGCLSVTLNIASAQTAVDDLDSLLSETETMSADVVQLIVESDGGILEESNIRMHLKKPDGFYWETLSPFPELIVTNGRLLWNYQPDLEQVVIENWDSNRSELAAQLLSGRTENLLTEYSIEVLTDTDMGTEEFDLMPKASDSVYETISINFQSGGLDMIYLNSKNGQQTVWQFRNIEKNKELADSLFEFVSPPGIEVIENSYVQ
jgi:outer membrane lipoprotein carrier protein